MSPYEAYLDTSSETTRRRLTKEERRLIRKGREKVRYGTCEWKNNLRRISDEEFRTKMAKHISHLEGDEGELAVFKSIDFRGHDFRGFNLRLVRFQGCDFNGANFTGAEIEHSSITGSDLLTAKGIKASVFDKGIFFGSYTQLPKRLRRPFLRRNPNSTVFVYS